MRLKMASAVDSPEENEAIGCVQCQKGSKLVLFVTGHCHWMCDYCPLSENRREVDVMFANERPCTSLDEVIEEARAMKATGTGITGGDPLMAREQSLEAIRRLKQEFGEAHHIHMYTSIPFPEHQARDFAEAGLDEIRFHLLNLELTKYLAIIKACEVAGIEVGIELPADPDEEERLFELLEELRHTEVTFLNLNELEITTGNQAEMELRGFNLSSEMTAGAEGSRELAIQLKNRVEAAEYGLPDPIDSSMREKYGYHLKFCTASYKDAGQLRARFRRRAGQTLAPHEQLTEDDTIMFGALYSSQTLCENDQQELIEVTGISPDWLRIDLDNERIEMPVDLAEELSDMVNAPVAIVEVHPTHERLEVSLVWLNDHRP
jgi:pyruvate formate-lyase activating enzyme-like uncharacterized protein